MASPEVATTSDPSETKNWRGPRAAYPARRASQPSALADAPIAGVQSLMKKVMPKPTILLTRLDEQVHPSVPSELAITASPERSDSHNKAKSICGTFTQSVGNVREARDGRSRNADVKDRDELRTRTGTST